MSHALIGRARDTEAATEARATAVVSSPRSSCIEILEGPDAGRTVPLGSFENVRALIGTSPACDIRLGDPKVSRRHAALDLSATEVRIVDLGSTNGTTVHGIRILDAFLQSGAIVRLGATVLRLTHSPNGAASSGGVEATHFGKFVGGSPQMRRIYPLCQRLAQSTVPAIIEGETGTGKEVLAEALHDASPRSRGPFVVFDCTAVPGNLVESELFGHERGAFTGASTPRKGMLEQAAGGTLFIDEIGDLDIALQPKLLRAVERREMRRLGGDRTIGVDVRILAATRRDLDREVQAGRFRDDLFHRLAVTRVELPPLRVREGDVRVLVRHFCEGLDVDPDSLPFELLARWDDYTWPGNVRELRNAIVSWVALGELPQTRAGGGPNPEDDVGVRGADFIDRILALGLPLTQARQRMVDAFDKRYVDRALAAESGHVGRAAAAAGIGRRYFQMLLARGR